MALTPMMVQYLETKEKCKDCILFFRIGDFYEMFFEDAEIASKELELVLTGKDCGLEKRAPMCGIPYHAADSYIGRLVNHGHKIAVCEQMEDPALAKGLVKRDIIKVITPGTYTDAAFLEDNKNNYIMSIFINGGYAGICCADVSTGEFKCTQIQFKIEAVIDELSKYNPSELVFSKNTDESVRKSINERFKVLITMLDDDYFYSNADALNSTFNEFEFKKYDKSLSYAANGLIKYIKDTQKCELMHMRDIEYYDAVEYMAIDTMSRRNLELTETLRDKGKKGSLLWVVDKTCTSMGARELRKWIEQPLVNKKKIDERLDSVEEISKDVSKLKDIQDSLKDIYDIERIVGRISSKSVNARELISLKSSIGMIPKLKSLLKDFKSSMLKYMNENIDPMEDIYNLLDKSICENPSITMKEGNLIKDGYNAEIDELRKAKKHGKEWIASLENKEREETGIRSLKVGYTKVFGYFIEISKANYNLIPDGRYIRKQTLSNAERFITPELKEMEDKILGAEEKLINLEYNTFCKIRDAIELHIERMKKTAKLIAELDVLTSFGETALDNNYCKPVISEDDEIIIKDGRHPVVEKMIPCGTFVANDTRINTKDEQLLLITGPNMAGKSTYMRQVAIIVIMAQIGSFVPASSARISLCDKIFTRIGASDDLSGGKSTFMVEMWEVSNILKNATRKSLVLLDEVGRGTSTYDGLSIAWSVIEYICNNKKLGCKTLFATHYHELTRLEGTVKGVKNYCVAVKEINNEVVFLRKIVEGGTDQSYGIEVAKLAGLPEELIMNAKEILKRLENSNKEEAAFSVCEEKKNISRKKGSEAKQINFSDIEKDNLLKELSDTDVMNMTPIDCMNKLYDMVKKAKMI